MGMVLRALRIARLALLTCVVIYAVTLGLAAAEIDNPLIGIGLYSPIAMGVSALACVVLQLYVLMRRPRNSN